MTNNILLTAFCFEQAKQFASFKEFDSSFLIAC